MNTFKTFSKAHPIILATLAFAFMFGLVQATVLVPNGPLAMGIKESVMAVIVFIVTFLFMGKEKVTFSRKGFAYGFRVLRGYYIFLIIFATLCIAAIICGAIMETGDFSYSVTGFIDILITGLFVGIVEEFVFRGVIFGGLVQKFNSGKGGIILAAVISGLLFGVMHVLDFVLSGEITNMGAVITAVLKTLQCGIFGIILAFVYYKTRNLFVVAALHSLDDFILFLVGSFGNMKVGNYVATEGGIAQYVIAYGFFTLILVPNLVRCIKDLKAEEITPFDDDFLPRKVVFKKKSKKAAK